jgi:hypothetical protein
MRSNLVVGESARILLLHRLEARSCFQPRLALELPAFAGATARTGVLIVADQASLIVTSNKGFLDWRENFQDHVLATAILDRIVHHATKLNIKGESYRVKEKRRAGLLGQIPQPQPEEAVTAG